MAISFPVDPSLVYVFARAVGDTDARYAEQLGAEPGTPLIVPLTFTRAIAEQFDQRRELGRIAPGDPVPEGGTADRFHAEQHFEYVRPIRAGERLTANSRPGRSWTKTGRDGARLDFSEELTDFVDEDGEPVVRTRRVGVKVTRRATR